MKKTNNKLSKVPPAGPAQQQTTVQTYLNLCAAIGERAYKAHCLQVEIENGYKQAAELEKQIMAEQAAVQTLRQEAEKEAGKILA